VEANEEKEGGKGERGKGCQKCECVSGWSGKEEGGMGRERRE